MYDEFIQFNPDQTELVLTRKCDPALYHEGDYTQLLKRHSRDVARAHNLRGVDGIRVLDPLLRKRIADTRTLFAACRHLTRRGVKAAGPNGNVLEDLSVSEQWSLCRALRAGMLRGRYQPGEVRAVRIPKLGKPSEFRTLTIQNVEDRVVARAVVEVLQPITEYMASPFSFGFRPGRCRLHALANAYALIHYQNNWLVAKADMENAFDRIPLSRLTTALSNHFPENVMRLIQTVVDRGQLRGIPQGSPLSPVLFNAYSDLTLGVAWARRRPESPLVRYADDLLIIGNNNADLSADHAMLEQLAASAGVPLKASKGPPVIDLAVGEPLRWLGYELQKSEGVLQVRIGERCWEQLHRRLCMAHEVPGSPIVAEAVVEGWLEQMGPCYKCVDPKAAISRILSIAADLRFDELPPARQLLQSWQLAYGRWVRLAKRESGFLFSRLHRSAATPLQAGA